MIPGLNIIENALTKEEELVLIYNCQSALAQEEIREWSGRSRVARFGWSYDDKGGEHELVGEMPDWLYKWLHIFDSDSVTINHYMPCSGILPHKDSLAFADPVHILSLGDGVVMVFTKPGYRQEVYIPARSLTSIGGESRYGWDHGIEARPYDLVGAKSIERKERWSIVFRKLLRTQPRER